MTRKKAPKKPRRKENRKLSDKKGDLVPNDIPLALEKLLPPDKIREIAERTKFVDRKRKIDPVAMIWVLILGFGVKIQRTLAGLKRSYEDETSTEINYGSWHERFTPELAKFMKEHVQLAMKQMAMETNRELSEKLKHFDDVMIQDSTVIRLHEVFKNKWPATRTRKVAAGIKVSTMISAVSNSPCKVTIHGERTSEIKTLKVGPWVKNRILLMDLGFYKHQSFARIEENGGFFVSRLKGNADPTIVAVNNSCRGNSIDVIGKKWSEVEDKLKRQILDVEVEVTVKRRKYKGKQKNENVRFRMVAEYNEDTRKYHPYLTNIQPDVLEPEDICGLYRVRWDIELVFKELKSKYALDVIKTKKSCIVETLIWTAILTMLVSRKLYNLLRASAPLETRVRYTPLRWANTFVETSDSFLKVVLDYFKVGPVYDRGFKFMARIWEHQALDPHVNRHRLPDGWWA